MSDTGKTVLTSSLLWGLFTGALYEGFFRKFDQAILYWVQAQSFHVLKIFFSVLSQIFSPAHWVGLGMVGVLIFLALTVKEKCCQGNDLKPSKWRLKLGFLGFSIMLAAIVGTLLKFGLARYRPEMLLEKNLYGFHFFSIQHEDSSSPSGHTTLSFAGLLAIGYLLKRPWITVLLVLLGLLIGLGRIILSAHYTSDVILGIYVGSICTYWVRSVRKW